MRICTKTNITQTENDDNISTLGFVQLPATERVGRQQEANVTYDRQNYNAG